MKRKNTAGRTRNILWQTSMLIFFWVSLSSIILGFANYLILCTSLHIMPFGSLKSMTGTKQSLIIGLLLSLFVFSFLMTAILIIIYRKVIYIPVKSLLSNVEMASEKIGLINHSTDYIRGARKNVLDLNNPKKLWTKCVDEYIECKTKDQYFDEMTGCLNRKYFSQSITETLKTQMMCSLSRKSTFMNTASYFYGIYLIDIDFFKKINDEFGHQYGDDVLGQVGKTLRSVVGSDGVVVRNGGEEFLIIVCMSCRVDFSKMAERIRKEFSETVYVKNPVTAEIRHITCSIGYLPFPFFHENQTVLSVEDHVNLADQLMYLAKSSGRNTWRGMEAVGTPVEETEFRKSVSSVDYGIRSGYFRIEKPSDIIRR